MPDADVVASQPPQSEQPATAGPAPATVGRPAARPDTDGRRRGLERLITFADAVVAIAATLLVLPLVSTATDIGTSTVTALLVADGHKLFAFVLSFAVICRFWIAHHSMYTNVIDYSRPLIWCTCLFLLSIVFLPFPTELIGAASTRDTAAVGLYIATLFVATAANLGQQWIIARTPALRAPDPGGAARIGPAVVMTAVMGVALVLAVTVPAIGLWSLLLLAGSGLGERWAASRRTPTTVTATPDTVIARR